GVLILDSFACRKITKSKIKIISDFFHNFADSQFIELKYSNNHCMSKLRTESIKSLFWKYSIPAIVASTSTSLYNIIDRIFIGQGVGPYAISGLALTLPLMNIAIALSTLIGAGAAAIISIRLGERRYNLANKTLGNATLLFFIFGGT